MDVSNVYNLAGKLRFLWESGVHQCEHKALCLSPISQQLAMAELDT